MYSLGLSIFEIQPFFLFLKLILIQFLPFLGFIKLYKLFNRKINYFIPFLISLWYAFNLFTLIYWNGNFFALTLLLCYALTPLGLYTYHSALFKPSTLTDLINLAIILFLMSFALTFFMVFILFIVLYTAMVLIKEKNLLGGYIKNGVKLVFIFSPLTLFYALLIRDMFYVTTDTVNLTGGETYSQLLGGFLYPFLMWFSWGIYSYWEPRNIFTFYGYFKNTFVVLSPFLIYGLILVGYYRLKNNRYIPIFLIIFIISIFLIKGVQPPFGVVFQYLIDNLAFFRVFRSPDSKLGFGIIFTLCLLLLLTSVTIRKSIFTVVMLAVILIQGFHIFSGTALIGENTSYSSDRLIQVPQDYFALKQNVDVYDGFNSKKYILSIPPVAFGHFNLGNNKNHIGQDILPLIIKRPFAYESEYSSMLKNTHSRIKTALNTMDEDILNNFPIKYILFRNDLYLDQNNLELRANLKKNLNLIYINPTFELYELQDSTEVITNGEELEIIKIHPAKFIVSSANNKDIDGTLDLMLNYHSDWLLIPYNTANNNLSFFMLEELFYPYLATTKAPSSKLKYGYANSWNTSPIGESRLVFNTDKNSDVLGETYSNNSYILYFKTQAYLYSIIIVVSIYILVLLGVLYKAYKKQ